jgi:hypothetical protein
MNWPNEERSLAWREVFAGVWRLDVTRHHVARVNFGVAQPHQHSGTLRDLLMHSFPLPICSDEAAIDEALGHRKGG